MTIQEFKIKYGYRGADVILGIAMRYIPEDKVHCRASIVELSADLEAALRALPDEDQK